jgi:hypothetical protein
LNGPLRGVDLECSEDRRFGFLFSSTSAFCEDSEERPGDGTEISYIQLDLPSKEAVEQVVEGKRLAVYYNEPFHDAEVGSENGLPADSNPST